MVIKEKNIRTQYLTHRLLGSGILNSSENHLLCIVSTRPNYLLENLSEIARLMHKSIRTVQRAIESLLQKGLIRKRYTYYKRLILTLVSKEEQDAIVSPGGLIKKVIEYCNFKKRKKKVKKEQAQVVKIIEQSHHTTSQNYPHATPQTQSTTNSNTNNSINKEIDNFLGRVGEKKGKFEFLPKKMTKEEQRAAFFMRFPHLQK